MKRLSPFLAIVALVATTLCARAAAHRILIVNAGSEAIFNLRVASTGAGTWGADLLGFDGVIDVSRGQDVTFDVGSPQCTYDVLARYDDGHEQVLHGIDLCSARELRFDH
jgi:hypothetical protein